MHGQERFSMQQHHMYCIQSGIHSVVVVVDGLSHLVFTHHYIRRCGSDGQQSQWASVYNSRPEVIRGVPPHCTVCALVFSELYWYRRTQCLYELMCTLHYRIDAYK